jgi:hypothetical protein
MEAETANTKRSLDQEVADVNDASAKKPKLEEPSTTAVQTQPTGDADPTEATISEIPRKVLHPNPLPAPVSRLGLKPLMPSLPPSLALITGTTEEFLARKGFVGEQEVGIIGYAGPKDVKGVRGVIKQR